MNFFAYLLISFLGILSAAYICRKSNLSLKIRFKLDINSRNKVMIINFLDILLLCIIYGFSKNTYNIIMMILSMILIFILIFVYYIASDIKGMIIKEAADEKKKNKCKFENEFCYFCGHKLENHEKVCPNCGKNIGDGS